MKDDYCDLPKIIHDVHKFDGDPFDKADEANVNSPTGVCPYCHDVFGGELAAHIDKCNDGPYANKRELPKEEPQLPEK